ncbi:MAG: tetratricopeptide repeat protein [Chloroherpetonaceae bacterium]|nr:tetratricopeptide repeat protein [Chloroherpetonaceae bacterium]
MMRASVKTAVCILVMWVGGAEAVWSQTEGMVRTLTPEQNQARLARWRAIRDSLSMVIRQTPEEWSAWVNRGFANAQLAQFEEAIADYDKAHQLAPNEISVLLHRASLYFSLGKYAEARQNLDAAIEQDPKNAELFYYRGLCKAKLKDDTGAIDDFTKSIRLKASPLTYYERGLAKARFRRYNEAIYDFDNAIELDRKFAFAYYARARAKLAQGQQSEAVLDLTRAQLLGCEPAAYLLSQIIEKSETLDSLRIYVNPEITITATKEEIRRATENTRMLAQMSVTALSTTNYRNPRSKLLSTGTALFNSGIAINDSECNEQLVQTRGATQVSIFCLIHLLKKQAAYMNDAKVTSLINQLSTLVAMFEDRAIDERQFLTEVQFYITELDNYMKKKKN